MKTYLSVRKKYLKALILLSAAWAHAQTALQKPNIVYILTDDQGYGDLYANLPDSLKALSRYNTVKAMTPNMDRLAESGVLFTDAHTTGNTCAPTRAGIMIGRYQQRAGLWDTPHSRDGLSLEETTLADVLKQGGYATAMIGKWHLGLVDQYNPRQRGFDYFYGFLGHGGHDYYDLTPAHESYNSIWRNYEIVDEGEGYLTDRIAEEAIGFIDRSKTKPFFAFVCFNGVHTPVQAPKTGPFAVNSTAPTRAQLMGMLGSMDAAIGRILDKLEAEGMTENTVVVFHTDNGGATATAADHGALRGNKLTMYEGGNRVPFILSWPARLKAGSRFQETIMSFDVFPTLVAAAGLEMPASEKVYDGVNLLPWMPLQSGNAVKTGPVHKALFWNQDEIWEAHTTWAARIGDWKLVQEKEGLQLFNLAQDIGERKNLAMAHPAKVKELEDAYRAWYASMTPQIVTKQGCKDMRYAEFNQNVTRHNEPQCLTLIPKKGCRNDAATNFDFRVTQHDEQLCEFSSVALGEAAPAVAPPLTSARLKISEAGPYRVTLFNLSGKPVFKRERNGPATENLADTGLRGMHVLKVSYGSTSFTARVLLGME